jgi:hypothetical protein
MELRFRWVLLATLITGGGMYAMFRTADRWFAHDMPGISSFLFILTGLGLVLGWLLVHALPLAYYRIRSHVLSELDGKYLEFRGQRMHVIENVDQVWLLAADLHKALGLKVNFRPKNYSDEEYQRFGSKDAGYSLKGVQRLCQTLTSRASNALPRWFEYDVLRPWLNKRGMLR